MGPRVRGDDGEVRPRARACRGARSGASARPPWTGWTWASWKPGVTVRPRSSMTRVDGPTCARDVGVRPDGHDPAVADGEGARPASGPASIVAIRPPRRTRSAGWASDRSVMLDGESAQRLAACARRRIPRRRDALASPAMTSVHLLHAGYTGERTASTVVLVRDGDALIVVDPGMVARRSLILDPLAALGVAPDGRHPRLPEPPPPRPHDERRAVPERRGRRLLGPLQGRPVARHAGRRLPTSRRTPSSG